MTEAVMLSLIDLLKSHQVNDQSHGVRRRYVPLEGLKNK